MVCKLFAPAKINLTLDILGKRSDGYHEIDTIMQTIALGDTVQFQESPQIEIETDHPQVPLGRANIALRAAELISRYAGITRGVKICIYKRIPIAAGLAGGSTDAAAVLRGLNKMWGLALSEQTMVELAAQLGSDVAFCLRGGTALGKGRGEQLQSLPPLPQMGVIIVKMPFAVSTKDVYQQYRPVPETKTTTAAMIQAVRSGNRRAVLAALSNMLEQVTINLHPEIAEAKERLLEAGAGGVLMSGSGPTVFGLTETREEAQEVARRFTGPGDVIVTETMQETGENN